MQQEQPSPHHPYWGYGDGTIVPVHHVTPVNSQIPSLAELLHTKKIQGNLSVRLANQLQNQDTV